MAHFICYAQGNRSRASRLGSPKSGVHAEAAGWDLGGIVAMYHNPETDEDEVNFTLTGGSGGASSHQWVGKWVKRNGVYVQTGIGSGL